MGADSSASGTNGPLINGDDPHPPPPATGIKPRNTLAKAVLPDEATGDLVTASSLKISTISFSASSEHIESERTFPVIAHVPRDKWVLPKSYIVFEPANYNMPRANFIVTDYAPVDLSLSINSKDVTWHLKPAVPAAVVAAKGFAPMDITVSERFTILRYYSARDETRTWPIKVFFKRNVEGSVNMHAVSIPLFLMETVLSGQGPDEEEFVSTE